MKQGNSKQRVLCAIALEQPDHVPMDFSANPATLTRLREALGAASHRELLDRLHVDIVDLRGVVDPVYRGPVPENSLRPDGVNVNYWGMPTKLMDTATGPEKCHCEPPLASANTVEELEAHRWPETDWFDFSEFGERLKPWADLAVMATGASVIQHATFLRGLENLLVDMLEKPAIADYLMDRFTDFYVDYFDRMFSAARGRIDILRIADDVGTQEGLLISPALFDRFLAPRIGKLIDIAHHHGIKVMFHSCGAIVPLIDRLIDLGIDILDPIQIRAKGMDPDFLKKTFGRRIALHGSVDTQYTLPRSSADDVEKEVVRLLDILTPGGGFILSPSHVLQTDVPTENILTLYETGHRLY